MKIATTLFLALFAQISICHAQSLMQKGIDIDGEAAGDLSGWSVSMPDAYTVAIGAEQNDGNGTESGHVRIYRWNGTAWVQKGGDIDGEATSDRSGRAVSMPDAYTVAIGTSLNDGNGVNSGHVRIYRWNGSTWVQKGTDIDGEAALDASAVSVSMPDSNTVAIGATGNDGNGTESGHVRIYDWNGSTWVQKGIDIDGEAASDHSGNAICMSDSNTVAIGAWGNDGNGPSAGHVRLYRWNGIEWVQKGSDIDGEAADDRFGTSVVMPDSNIAAIGAWRNSGNGTQAGHVRIYRWNGSTWVQKGTDIDGEAAWDQSGYSVDMPDSNTVAIGADGNDGNGFASGHVRIYRWDGSAWVQIGADIDGEAQGDRSGWSVSMPDSNTVAIGAYSNAGNGSNSGHVRIYTLKGVQGLVYNDFNENCIQEEIGIANVMGIIQPGNIVVETNSDGRWYIESLAAGSYTIVYDTSGSWRATCPNPQNFTVVNPNGSTLSSFGMINTNPCAEPSVSVYMPFMRPGFSNQKLYVSACNENTGTGALDSAYTILHLDSLLTLQSSTLPYTSLGNNQYSFELDTIYPGECKSFSVACSLSLNADLGQTLCMEAELFPQQGCLFDSITPAPTPADFTPCSLPWDNSNISINEWCQNDSIFFTVTNTGIPGSGDMDCFSPVRFFIDGQYISLDSVQLAGGQTDTIVFTADGRTFRLEVDQHPLHPGGSKPNATVELCSNDSNWTAGLVNILPMDDADPIVDIYCGMVSGSYDPNDKTGFPLGVSDSHFVAPNGKLDYVIRFQNTGTDTAFTVVIRDTLDTDLNIFSVSSGVSSHEYSFKMYGPRVLEWTFDNIMLPDSSVDLEGSNGFITFTVNQVVDLSVYTEINNSVGIYFDFNTPIITNTTSHIIKTEGISTHSWNAQDSVLVNACEEYVYNNETYTKTGTYWQIENDTLRILNLAINTVDADVAHTSPTLTANALGAAYQWLDCDSNFAIISGETSQVFTPTMNGNYAVEVIENNCIDTSVCLVVNNVGILENSFGNALTIYPNPTNGALSIDLGEHYNELTVNIRNQLGQNVLKKSFNGSNHLQINIPGEVGVYLIEVTSDDKKAILKVVKE